MMTRITIIMVRFAGRFIKERAEQFYVFKTYLHILLSYIFTELLS